jgi:hypothetical protein
MIFCFLDCKNTHKFAKGKENSWKNSKKSPTISLIWGKMTIFTAELLKT